MRTLLDDIEGATAHLQIESLSPPLRARIVNKRDRYERALRRLIADGVRSGEFVAPDSGACHARHARRDELDRDLVPARRRRTAATRRRCHLRRTSSVASRLEPARTAERTMSIVTALDEDRALARP